MSLIAVIAVLLIVADLASQRGAGIVSVGQTSHRAPRGDLFGIDVSRLFRALSVR